MGAGHLLASYHDTTVITVLGGRPPAYPHAPTEWDALGGFVAGDDVVAVRREEDVAAMAVLESGYRWLEFADHQYLAPEDRPTPDEVAPVLGATIDELDPTSVFFPMGLANPDHVMVHDACLLGARGPARPGVVLLRGPRLQASPRVAGLAGGQDAARASVADARPSSPTCPTRNASAGPSGATRRRSRPSSVTTRSRRAWTAGCPSSSGGSRPAPGWEGLADFI